VIILFNKPYGVLSQFTIGTHPGPIRTLRDFGPFPADVYPVGRLDADSEGLLLLTNDRLVKERLLDPVFHHPRTYLVQVERVPGPGALLQLANGKIVLDGQTVRPATAKLLAAEPDLPPRPVPIRFRKNVPTAWIELTLFEGKNRQVRRMTAAAGHPALRLFRTSVGSLSVRGLEPGKWRALSEPESARFQKALRAHRARV
jgi:23S rRNA pseudouridine2457 synthase